jgi:hypothetical protein
MNVTRKRGKNDMRKDKLTVWENGRERHVAPTLNKFRQGREEDI